MEFSLHLFGVDELCRHLRAEGIEAEVLSRDSEERLERGWLRSDLGYVKTAGWPIDLVAIRFGGALSPHPRNWSTSLSLKSLPLFKQNVQPVQYHFALSYRQIGTAADFSAKLRRPGRLLLGSEAGPRWTGGALAERLQRDHRLTEGLTASLGDDERLRVQPEFRQGCIRVILKSRLVFQFQLLPEPKVRFEQGLPSSELLEHISAVARHVRALM